MPPLAPSAAVRAVGVRRAFFCFLDGLNFLACN